MKKIAIFASGNGSNAENIIRHFNQNQDIASVALVVCNKPSAKVIQRSSDLGVPVEVLTRDEINNPDVMMRLLDDHAIDFIVLAGFLLMIPAFLTQRFTNRIVNIHPSLLPKYGGKGMFGHHVHEAVVAAGETETGITIHYVSDLCDKGQIIFQAATPVTSSDTPESVEAKVHALERLHFPQVIASLL